METKRVDSIGADTSEYRDLQVDLVKQEFRRAKDYSSEYHQSNTPIAHFFNTRVKRVSELLSDFKSGNVLDVGCGPAKIGNTFRDRPIKYYGVDISDEMIRECKDTFGHDPQFHFSLGRIEELPFPASYFDVVLCLGAFEYLPKGHIAMREIARVLKPKGTIIVSMHNRISPYRLWFRYGFGKLKNGANKVKRLIIGKRTDMETTASKRLLFRVYGDKAFRQLLAAERLRVEDTVYYDFNVFFVPLDALFPRASVYLSRKLEFLCRSKLKLIGTGFILKCRKNE